MRVPSYFAAVCLAVFMLGGCDNTSHVSVPIVELDANLQAKYDASCKTCHEIPQTGAPQKGDVPAWAPIVEQPIELVLNGVINGINGMPPLGQCFDCSKEDLTRLVYYMAQEAEG